MVVLFVACALFICVSGLRVDPDGVPEHILDGQYVKWTSPGHVHLSVTGRKDEMVVMWATPKTVAHPIVEYWSEDGHKQKQKATTTTYTLKEYTSPFIHTARVSKLHLNTAYTYHCGEDHNTDLSAWSSLYTFKTEPAATEHPFTFVALADHGTSPNSTEMVQTLLREMNNSNYRIIIHSGDISYANGKEPIWDDYFNMVEPVSSLVPWQTAPGNHEQERKSNFLAYRHRYSMPWKESGSSEPNMWHSFDYENAHFIALNSEVDDYNTSSKQYKWLQKDLKNVNRSKTPWVFIFFHTPMYCTNKAHLDEGVRMRSTFEKLFYEYNVDVVFSGHVHAYERTVPIYKGVENQKGPVYITNGAGGTQEGLADEWIDAAEWTAFRQSESWGLGLIKIYNSTHMTYEFKEVHENRVLDSAWIVRQRK